MSIVPRMWAAVLALATLWAPAVSADDAVGLAAFERLDRQFDTRVEESGAAELSIAGFGRRWSLTLEENETLLGRLDASSRNAVHGRDNLFLAGHVVSEPDSWARLSRVGGTWSGGFYDGDELYLIDRAAGLRLPAGRSAAPDDLLLYRFSDLDLAPILLHRPVSFTKLPRSRPTVDYREFLSHLRDLTELDGNAPFLMPITVVTDTQFNNQFGANTAAVVASRVNFIDGLYTSQLGTGIQLFHHEPLASDGTLTAIDAGDLLTQFRLFMTTGAGSGIPFQGLAHLFTARSRDGSIAGIAYLGVLCSTSFGQGVDWNLTNETTNGLVFAHEVGHNFNAPHDGEGACQDETFNGIMNPSINGSQQFSNCSLQQMSGAVAGAGCLIPNPLVETMFVDGFEID